MKQNFRKHLRPLAVLAAAALLLTGCKGVTEEEKTARENGIALLESGDYEGPWTSLRRWSRTQTGSQTLRWIS